MAGPARHGTAARGIRFQVAALSCCGVIVVGAILCLAVGSKRVRKPRPIRRQGLPPALGAVGDFLQARQLATEFMQKRRKTSSRDTAR